MAIESRLTTTADGLPRLVAPGELELAARSVDPSADFGLLVTYRVLRAYQSALWAAACGRVMPVCLGQTSFRLAVRWSARQRQATWGFTPGRSHLEVRWIHGLWMVSVGGVPEARVWNHG
jgi:hypothetical protein